MTKTQILKKIAELESINDQLSSEIQEIDILLRSSGFPNGLASLKAVAQEMLQMMHEEQENMRFHDDDEQAS
jgi:short-subunit dehydrogenase